MSAFLTVAIIHLLAVASPGPDFAIVTRNSLAYSRRTGIMTALGVALGLGVHSAYCLLGIGLIISRSIVVFNVIKWVGALYLIFIGWKALTAKASAQNADATQSQDISPLKALRIGFLCNVLNPKATLFILALFTQVISSHTPIALQIFYGAYMSVATFLWFSCIASLFTIASIKAAFHKAQHTIERCMGAILIALGLKVAFATRD